MSGFVYGFERLSVLVVEDSEDMSSLLVGILKALNFGRVSTAVNGEAATGVLRSFLPLAEARDDTAVDFVLSDWRMAPMDGAELLRWIRQHSHDAIRYIPFIMLTGYTEHGRIIEARDLGVTEFLRKPVSVNALVSRFSAVIERPRPYVKAPGFFGPDRRRQTLPFKGLERRKAGEEHGS